MDYILLFLIGAMSFASEGNCAAIGEKLAFVRELDKESSWKRNLDEDLPEHIPLELATDEGKVHLILQREHSLKSVDVLLETQGQEHVVDLDHKNVGIYTDMDKNAVIKVDRSDGEGKRTYTGSLVHEGKQYELHPLGAPSDSLSKLMARAVGSDLSAHRLRRVETDMPGKDSYDFENAPWQRRDYEEALKVLKSFVERQNEENNNTQGDDTIQPIRPIIHINPDNNPNSGRNIQESVNQGDQLEEKMQDLLKLLRNSKAQDQQQAEVDEEDGLSDELQEERRYKSHFDSILSGKSRKKRNIPIAYTNPLEDYKFTVAIFVDDSVFDYWTKELGYSSSAALKEISYFVSHLFNGVSMAFRRINFAKHGFSITPWLKEIKIFQSKSDIAFMQGAMTSDDKIEATLVAQQIGAYRMKYDKYGWYNNMGHIMYLTKRDLTVDRGSSAVGVSPTCSVCDTEYGFSIIEIHGYFTFIAMTHELGHNLGAKHDGEGNDCSSSDMYLMTPYDQVLTPANVENGFQFSKCSLEAIRACMSGRRDAIGKPCLYANVCEKKQPLTDITTLPGDKYSLDTQCQLFVDDNAVYDKRCLQGADMCLKLACRVGDQCRFGHNELKPMPGSSCGGKKVCMWGECTRKNMKNYYDLSCRKKTAIGLNEVPEDCLPDRHPDCERYAKTLPSLFFSNNDLRVYCPTTTKTYGLHFDFVNPCWSNRLDHVSCLYDERKYIIYSQLNDGREDCPGGTDEIGDLVNRYALQIPFCFADNLVHNPKDFKQCVPVDNICQNNNYKDLCAKLTEYHLIK